jgi:beta-lactamase class A
MRTDKGISQSAKYGGRIARSLLPLVLLLVGLLAGFVIRGFVPDKKPAPQHYQLRENGYKYVNPLLACDSSPESEENIELEPLKRVIEKTIQDQIDKRWISDASVYFRRLNSGKWFSVRSVEKFSPASLLKVPLMIAVLREEELKPGFAKKRLKLSGPPISGKMQNFKPSKVLEAGKYYTVDELLYRLVVYSDNDADTLLWSALNPVLLEKTFTELRVPSPFGHQPEDDFLSVEAFATFFRVLYNATLLSKDMSEKALDLLTKAEFKEGLVAGIPSNLAVAHKFGERVFGQNGEVKELHDCGIVYYPDHPYLLCVMTKGSSFEYLDDVIEKVSHIAYEGVNHTFPQH